MAEIDLTTCESEPIHIPGMIQPHGVLLVLRVSDLSICHASANAEAILGMPVQELLGQSIDGVLGDDAQQANYRQVLSHSLFEGKPVYLFTVHAGAGSTVFDAIAHRNGDLILFELEPVATHREVSVQDLYRLVQSSILGLRESQTVESLCGVCASQVRQIAGFDRVMVYRFDEEWNGQVIAEQKREDLEPFHGLRYPASDIPRQARELYTKNWLRFIPDRSYVPAAVVALPGDAAAKPLDMSYSVLRSVSPVHLQYLQNMGVGASMSVSILKNGVLWGLIACHHYSPRRVPYDIRTACELLAQLMSSHLAAAEDRELVAYANRLKSAHDALLRSLEQTEDFSKSLVEGSPNLLDFIHAGGAAVVDGAEISRVGQTPGEDQIRELAKLFQQKDFDEVFSTDDVSGLSGSGLMASVAAGALVLKLSQSSVRQLIWFRPERVRTVHWAGDPSKTVAKGEVPDRLSPRGSFALWKQTVHGRSEPWTGAEIYTARLFRQQMISLLIRRAEASVAANKDLRLASVEREKALESERSARSEAEKLNRIKDEFVATLSHELRTPLNAILGWAQLIRRDELSENVAEAMEIIERNARAQSQIIEDLLEMSRIISGKLRLDLQETNLPSIVQSAIDTVQIAADAKMIRLERLIDPLLNVQTTGDPSRLQQVVWNLLSNAVKFTPRGGKVQIVLERVNSHVELSVADTGIGIKPDFLPHVFDRFRQADASSSRKHGGLGLGLSIVRSLVELHGGTVRAQSRGEGEGTTFVVSLPIRVMNVAPAESRTHPRSQQRPVDGEALHLAGVRTLVVDDEVDARSLVERLLEECGCVVTKAGSVSEALEHLQRDVFDVLISDVGMPGEDGFSLIRKLRELEESRGREKLPAIALTAYARTEDRRRAMLAGFQAHVAKPVEAGELLAIVASLAGRI